jgi:hypothetical protein
VEFPESVTKIWFPLLLLLHAGGLITVQLGRPTVEAFDRYVRTAEARLQPTQSNLWAEASAERNKLVRDGRVLAEPWSGDGDIEIPGGLIHDWVGAVYLPGATLDRTLAMVQNYDGHKNIYKPEVIDSRLIGRQDGQFRVYLRLLKKKVITVVLNTQHDAQYWRSDRQFAFSRSYSTRIAEVDNPGKADERELPPGNDHGFLWRLNSYWRFAEREGGVYVECEAISLTRDVPTGLGWLVNPIVRSLPRESLANTLRATRDAVVGAR